MNQRPIDFRAWHLPTKRMFNVYTLCAGHVFENSLDGVGTLETLPALRSDCIVLQFTGLKTTDGTDMYEGDILRTEYTETTGTESGTITAIHNLVEFRDGAFGYIGENTGQFCVFEYDGVKDGVYDGCTVAGNVFEHPQLLEEPQEVKEANGFNPERYKGFGYVYPVFSGNLCNWPDWQESVRAMAKCDGIKLTADEWDDLRHNYFNNGELSMAAYECYFVANRMLTI